MSDEYSLIPISEVLEDWDESSESEHRIYLLKKNDVCFALDAFGEMDSGELTNTVTILMLVGSNKRVRDKRKVNKDQPRDIYEIKPKQFRVAFFYYPVGKEDVILLNHFIKPRGGKKDIKKRRREQEPFFAKAFRLKTDYINYIESQQKH